MTLRERDDVLSTTDVSPLTSLATSSDERLASRVRTLLSACRIDDSARIHIALTAVTSDAPIDLDLAFDKNGRLELDLRRKLRFGPAPRTLVPSLFLRASALDANLRRVAGSDVVLALQQAHEAPEVQFSALLDAWMSIEDKALRVQIAWVAQQRGFGPMVRELATIAGTDEARRLAALDLMIEAMGFRERDKAPIFRIAKTVRTRSIPQSPDITLGRTHNDPFATDMLEAPELLSEDLPRELYAVAEAPTHVVAAQELTLTAGVTPEAPEEGATPFVRPATSVGEYAVVLSIQAIGFTARDNLTVFTLPVTKAKRNPSVDIHLIPDVVEDTTERTIAIFYSIDGQVIGSVERKIVVHIEENDETRAAAREALRRVFSAPTSDVPPDLTVMIRDDGQGKLAWSFITPFKDVVVPRNPVHVGFNATAKTFADVLMNTANAREGKVGLYEFLVGVGAEIRALMPPQFWSIVQKAGAAAKKETPSLLLISNEPYIPWELAVLPKTSTLFHPELAPFLGVQMCVGRWLIGDRLPPPRQHTIRNSYVVSGTYNRPNWNRLVKAEEEAAEIQRQHGATPVEAKFDLILGIFDAQPPPDLLHFSMHGRSDDDSTEEGLVPIDSGYVKPQMITGAIERAQKTPSPFVFLNACQVARGDRILGDYGGIAAAFVKGGAIGVIAPLWSVKDDLAKEIALNFYKAVLEEKIEAAEAMRRARASFVQSSTPISATYLAYQYFGHPSLQLRK